MRRIYDRYEDDERLALLSHTIDPKRDTVGRLKKYEIGLDVKAPKWQFVTGEKEVIYDIAQDYMSIAKEDENAPGGFDHSGKLILTDTDGHVRAFCEGTDPEDVTQFIVDVKKLLKSYSH